MSTSTKHSQFVQFLAFVIVLGGQVFLWTSLFGMNLLNNGWGFGPYVLGTIASVFLTYIAVGLQGFGDLRLKVKDETGETHWNSTLGFFIILFVAHMIGAIVFNWEK